MKKLLLLAPLFAYAHPHQWIDLRVTPETDASGALTALHESWEFDPYTSGILLQRNADAKALTGFKKDIDQYYKDQHGFTYSDTIVFESPCDNKIEQKNGILYYHYTMPLKTPVRGKVQYKIYENSYYMDITYAADQPKQWENGCRLRIIEASPSAEEEELAASFDQNAQAPAGLGAVFAQTSEMHCSQ